METRKLTDLTVQELVRLATTNKTFSGKVFNAALDNCNMWVSEYLYNAPFEWYGGYFDRRYISNIDFYKLPDYMEHLIKSYGAFYEHETEIIKKAEQAKDLTDKLEYPISYGINAANYDRIERKLDTLTSELKTAIIDFVGAEYEYLENTPHNDLIAEYLDVWEISEYFGDDATTDGVNIYETITHVYH